MNARSCILFFKLQCSTVIGTFVSIITAEIKHVCRHHVRNRPSEYQRTRHIIDNRRVINEDTSYLAIRSGSRNSCFTFQLRYYEQVYLYLMVFICVKGALYNIIFYIHLNIPFPTVNGVHQIRCLSTILYSNDPVIRVDLRNDLHLNMYHYVLWSLINDYTGSAENQTSCNDCRLRRLFSRQ